MTIHRKMPLKIHWAIPLACNLLPLETLQPLRSDFSQPLNPARVGLQAQITVSSHNFKSQNFKLSVSNPKSKYVDDLSLLSQIWNCQGLGRTNKHEILKADRRSQILRAIFRPPMSVSPIIVIITVILVTIIVIITCIIVTIIVSIAFTYIYIYVYTYGCVIYIYIYIYAYSYIYHYHRFYFGEDKKLGVWRAPWPPSRLVCVCIYIYVCIHTYICIYICR